MDVYKLNFIHFSIIFFFRIDIKFRKYLDDLPDELNLHKNLKNFDLIIKL